MTFRTSMLLWALGLVVVLALLAPAGRVEANGVPTSVNLKYIDLSNWGPKDATGKADLILAEGIVRVSAQGLPALTDKRYQAWLVSSQTGDAISAGRFNADASGKVDYKGSLPPISNFGFDLFILSVEPDPDDAPQPTADRSIGGYFSLVGQRSPDGKQEGMAPGQLPNTGDADFATDLMRGGALIAVMALSVFVGLQVVESEARMIRGLYTAASGMLLGLRQQDVLSENMANASTVGYKAEASSQSAFGAILASSVGDKLSPVPGSDERLIGRIGTGAFIDKTRIVMAQGADRPTGAPLDVMVRGEGFLVMETPNGVRYTRDGHMKRSDTNILVNSDGGQYLDDAGQPITVDTDNVRIKSDGGIYRLVPTTVQLPDGTTSRENKEELIAHIKVVTLPLPSLIRAGDSQFMIAEGTPTTPVDFTTGAVSMVQGTLEEANVVVNSTATDMFSLARVFASSQKVFNTINESLDEAVNKVGKV